MATVSLHEERLMESYWALLRHCSDSLKLKLAARLANDVASRADETSHSADTANVVADSAGLSYRSTSETEAFLASIDGGFCSEWSDDELMAVIRENSSIRQPIQF